MPRPAAPFSRAVAKPRVAPSGAEWRRGGAGSEDEAHGGAGLDLFSRLDRSAGMNEDKFIGQRMVSMGQRSQRGDRRVLTGKIGVKSFFLGKGPDTTSQ